MSKQEFRRFLVILALMIMAVVLDAVLFRVVGLTDDGYTAATLPAPEYIHRDEAILALAEPPEQSGSGLATPEQAEPVVTSRYEPLTDEEIELIARVVYCEANSEPIAGQQAVAEVILNRRAAHNFPDTVEEVVYQTGQFSVVPSLPYTTPTETNYAAVYAAMYGEPVYESMDVVYFNGVPENHYIAGVIGGHYFCYQYPWAMEVTV